MQIEDVINRSELNERLDGNMDLFIELADLFIDDSPNLLKAIENAINEKDAMKVKKAAHTLKGTVSNFSAVKAYEAAYTLEEIGKNNELSKAEEAFKVLKKEIENTVNAMILLKKEDSI